MYWIKSVGKEKIDGRTHTVYTLNDESKHIMKGLADYTDTKAKTIHSRMVRLGVFSKGLFNKGSVRSDSVAKVTTVSTQKPRQLTTRSGKVLESTEFERRLFKTPKASDVPYLHESVQNRIPSNMTDRSVAKYRKLLEKFNNRCEKYNTRTAIFLSAHDRVGGWWGTV